MVTSATTTTAAGAAPKLPKNHLDVEEELAFYASYHSNKINQIIHFICIPQILWSWLAIIAHVALPGSKHIVLGKGLAFQPNLALGWIVAYMGYYLRLEPMAGLTYLPIGILSYLTATYVAATPPASLPFSSAAQPTGLPFAWTVFGFAWIAQFVGHGAFEHRAPALTESLVQGTALIYGVIPLALVTAPFFVHLEFLFSVFNYKPELQKKIKNKSGIRIREMNKSRAAKLK